MILNFGILSKNPAAYPLITRSKATLMSIYTYTYIGKLISSEAKVDY